MDKDDSKETIPLTEEELKEHYELGSRSIKMVREPDEDYEKSLSYRWFTFKHWIKDNNPFGRYLIVKSVDEYLSLSRKNRTVFWFWYKDVIVSYNRAILGRKAERDEIESYLRKHYPIQKFLRKIGYSARVRLEVLYDKLCDYLNPKQKWLVKKIPNSYSDIVYLIPTLNFEMIVQFVEVELDGKIVDEECPGTSGETFSSELRDCYDYIKNRRPELVEKMDNSYPDPEAEPRGYAIDYADLARYELELSKLDTKYLTWIVSHREYFWT